MTEIKDHSLYNYLDFLLCLYILALMSWLNKINIVMGGQK